MRYEGNARDAGGPATKIGRDEVEFRLWDRAAASATSLKRDET
jgi:hypothetical protein